MKRKISSMVMACIMAVGCLWAPAYAVAQGPELDAATKETYYAEYIKIAEEVAKATELDISVLPMDEFEEDDWQTPEEFRNFITEIANWTVVCTDVGPQTRSTASATKSDTITADGHNYTIEITGQFTTTLNTATGRQHFAKVNSITSKVAGRVGSWTQTGYEYEVLDASRTVSVTVSGELVIGGARFSNKLAVAEFYCSNTGVVS